jgi:hypothetical protein
LLGFEIDQLLLKLLKKRQLEAEDVRMRLEYRLQVDSAVWEMACETPSGLSTLLVCPRHVGIQVVRFLVSS